MPEPHFYPYVEGGVSMEWFSGDADITVDVNNAGELLQPDAFLWMLRQTGQYLICTEREAGSAVAAGVRVRRERRQGTQVSSAIVFCPPSSAADPCQPWMFLS